MMTSSLCIESRQGEPDDIFISTWLFSEAQRQASGHLKCCHLQYTSDMGPIGTAHMRLLFIFRIPIVLDLLVLLYTYIYLACVHCMFVQ